MPCCSCRRLESSSRPNPRSCWRPSPPCLQAGAYWQQRQAAPPRPAAHPAASPALGLGQWLLISGLQQIDADLAAIKRLLTPPPTNLVLLLVLQGRLRELSAARELLLLLWGPLSVAWGAPDPFPSPEPVLAITLQQRSADGIWRAIRQRLEAGSGAELSNQSGQLLALEGLSPERRRDLLLALLCQVDSLRQRLLADPAPLQERWEQWQPELRQQAMRSLVNSYVQLPCEGSLLPVADSLLRSSDLTGRDPELPEAQPMLASLVRAQPCWWMASCWPPTNRGPCSTSNS